MANRDLNVGAIVSLTPNLKPFTDLLNIDTETVKKVLASWGPGRFDAELDKDGKALMPQDKPALSAARTLSATCRSAKSRFCTARAERAALRRWRRLCLGLPSAGNTRCAPRPARLFSALWRTV